MSKSTETTNDRVPRVLVRFGKHPSSVGNTHRVWETPIKCMETPIERGETPIKCGETPIECVETLVSRGETPIERGETLVSRGETSIERGETLVSRGALPRRCRGVAEG